jgi:hypothetical protein
MGQLFLSGFSSILPKIKPAQSYMALVEQAAILEEELFRSVMADKQKREAEIAGLQSQLKEMNDEVVVNGEVTSSKWSCLKECSSLQEQIAKKRENLTRMNETLSFKEAIFHLVVPNLMDDTCTAKSLHEVIHVLYSKFVHLRVIF